MERVRLTPLAMPAVDLDRDEVVKTGLRLATGEEVEAEAERRGITVEAECDREHVDDVDTADDLACLLDESDIRDLTRCIVRGDTRSALETLERIGRDSVQVSKWIFDERYSAANRRAA